MESTNAKPKMIPLPKKLQRLRRAKMQLRAALDDATARYRTLTSEVRKARSELIDLEAEPKPYTDDESSELARELKAKRSEVKHLESLLEDVTTEREEIQADLKPTLQTVRDLEDYLGVVEGDEFIRADQHRYRTGNGAHLVGGES